MPNRGNMRGKGWEIHDAKRRLAGQARAGTVRNKAGTAAEGRPHRASQDHEGVHFHHKNAGKPLECDMMGL